MLRSILIPLLVLISVNISSAQTADHSSVESFDTLSLEDLLNTKITVASVKGLTPRQSPGIVSYINADDIRHSGARDLMELLSQIPGIEFGVDVEGVVGMAIRGNWAHEGKVVLIIDGQEMNEGLYSTIQLGNHYPIDNIEKIEIIRGPGSALYGGNAAYAVINVITRSPQPGKQLQASATYGTTKEDYSRRGANLFLATKKDKNSISLQTTFSQSQRSNQQYTDVYGVGYDMTGNSGIQNAFLNLGASTGNLGFRFIVDQYIVNSRDEYINSRSRYYPLNFNSYNGELFYTLMLSEKLTILPKINYRYQVPWASESDPNSDEIEAFKISSERATASVKITYDPIEQLNFTAGGQYFYDRSRHLETGATFISTNKDELNYYNSCVFAQGMLSSEIVNVIAGFRYNNNSMFESTLVPRVGLTKEINNFHLKALYSRSFRSPSTQNIDLSTSIRPEKTDVVEFEVGMRISEYMNCTINIYSMYTQDPIIYFYDTLTNFDAYTNSDQIGTKGFEFTFQYKKERSGFDFNASYYRSNDKNINNPYSNLNNNEEHLGLSPLKLGAQMHYQLKSNLTAYASVEWSSQKTAITSVSNDTNEPTYTQLPSNTIININLDYKFKKVKGLSTQFGIYNLLDEIIWYAQPYNSYHAPLPGIGREFQLKLIYQIF